MDVSNYIGFVASEGDRFTSAVERGDLSVAITPCPGWDMRERACLGDSCNDLR